MTRRILEEEVLPVKLINFVNDKNLAEFKRCVEQPDCDVNKTDATGLTALMRADRHVSCSQLTVADTAVYLEMIQLLLRHPMMDINTRSTCRGYYRCTALHIACGAKKPYDRGRIINLYSSKAAEMLLQDERCDVNAYDYNGGTPLMCAVRQVTSEDCTAARIVRLLLSRPECDVNSALSIACAERKRMAAAKVIIDDWRLGRDEMNSSLIEAAENGNFEAISLLLEHCNRASSPRQLHSVTSSDSDWPTNSLNFGIDYGTDTPLMKSAAKVLSQNDKYAETVRVMMQQPRIDTCIMNDMEKTTIEVFIDRSGETSGGTVDFDVVPECTMSVGKTLLIKRKQNARNL